MALIQRPDERAGKHASRFGMVVSVAILAAAVLLVYGQTMWFSFLRYDDEINLTNNPYLRSDSLRQVLVFWSQGYEGLYIPVTYTFWSLLAFGTNLVGLAPGDGVLHPGVYHASNLVLHWFVSCVVFLLIRTLWHNDRAALFGALLFAVHPLHVESVAWVTEAKGLLSAGFGLLSIYVLLSLHRRDAGGEWASSPPGKTRRLLTYLGATVLYVLALLAKPSAVVIPLIAFVVEVGLRRRRVRDVVMPMVGWLGLAVVVAAITARLQEEPSIASSWDQRLFVVGDSLTFYFQKLLLPTRLTPVYDRPLHSDASKVVAVVSMLIPLLGVGVMLLFNDRRVLGSCALIFVCGLLPNLGFMDFTFQSVATVADRYAYLALLGPALLVAWVAMRFTAKWFSVALALYLCMLSIASAIQAARWSDDKTLFTYTLAVNPRSADAHNALGNVAVSEGRAEEAREQYGQALEIAPNHFRVWYNLGVLQFDQQQFNEAAESFLNSISNRPEFLPAWRNLALAYLQAGQTDRAIEVLSQTLGISGSGPDDVHRLGVTLMRNGRLGEAETVYSQATQRWPNWAEAHAQLARCLAKGGELTAARQHAETAKRLDPAVEVDEVLGEPDN